MQIGLSPEAIGKMWQYQPASTGGRKGPVIPNLGKEEAAGALVRTHFQVPVAPWQTPRQTSGRAPRSDPWYHDMGGNDAFVQSGPGP